MIEDQQKQAVSWSKSKPLLHLITSVRADELNLPIAEGKYGSDNCLFGWVVSKENHLPLNIWTKRFQDWYEQSTGSTLIDHEIVPAYQAMSDEAEAVYAACEETGNCDQHGEKEKVLCMMKRLEQIARTLQSEYQHQAEKLASAISAASASEDAQHKEDYHKHIAELTQMVDADLKTYCEQYCKKD